MNQDFRLQVGSEDGWVHRSTKMPVATARHRHVSTRSYIIRVTAMVLAGSIILSIAACSTTDTTTKGSVTEDKYVMRYYGGPKNPMYAAPRE